MNVYLLMNENDNDNDTESGNSIEGIYSTEAGARIALQNMFPDITITWYSRFCRCRRFKHGASYHQFHVEEHEVLT